MKPNSECRFLAYAKLIDETWTVRVYDTFYECICYSFGVVFDNTKQHALDLACKHAAFLEEQADKADDHRAELDEAFAMSGGQG